MTRLFYQLNDDIYFDRRAFNRWAREMGFYDMPSDDDIAIEWIDRSGLIHVS